MKVVIGGGSGLIGRHLGAALVEAGHQPVVLSRHRARRSQPGVRTVRWDPPRPGPWMAELADATAVVNLAGESVGVWPWTAGRRRALRRSRLDPTNALLAAIAAVPAGRRPSVLLSASGTDVYEGRDAMPADEATPVATTFLARLCLDWEAAANRAEPLGLRVVLLRTSTVICRDAPFLRRVSLPFRLFLGGRIGSGRQWMSWIHIVDVIGLIRWAIEDDGVRGPLNLAAPDPRRQADFGRLLAAAVSRPFWLTAPAWAVRLVLGPMSILALGSRRVWPGRALAAGYAFKVPTLETALALAT